MLVLHLVDTCKTMGLESFLVVLKDSMSLYAILGFLLVASKVAASFSNCSARKVGFGTIQRSHSGNILKVFHVRAPLGGNNLETPACCAASLEPMDHRSLLQQFYPMDLLP